MGVNGHVSEDNIRWARAKARAIATSRRAWSVVQDLEQEAVIGLMQAAERYDHGAGVKFRTFAERRVDGAVFDFLRGKPYAVSHPRNERPQVFSIEACSEEYVESVLRSAWRGFDVEAWQAGFAVREAIARLRPIQSKIITDYFYGEKKEKEIGEEIGISESRVCQTMKKACAVLRGLLDEHKTRLTKTQSKMRDLEEKKRAAMAAMMVHGAEKGLRKAQLCSETLTRIVKEDPGFARVWSRHRDPRKHRKREHKKLFLAYWSSGRYRSASAVAEALGVSKAIVTLWKKQDEAFRAAVEVKPPSQSTENVACKA